MLKNLRLSSDPVRSYSITHPGLYVPQKIPTVHCGLGRAHTQVGLSPTPTL